MFECVCGCWRARVFVRGRKGEEATQSGKGLHAGFEAEATYGGGDGGGEGGGGDGGGDGEARDP
jgi:hypothetical protein